MQGGRFCNPRRVPLQHTPCILTCQRQGSKKLDVFQNNISFSSQNNQHTVLKLKYFLFVHNTAIFCCFETSHWWCTSFYGVAPETWRIEMKYFLKTIHTMYASFCAMFGTLHHDAPELWHALVQLLRCTSFLPLSTVLHQSEVFSTPSRQITTDVSSW